MHRTNEDDDDIRYIICNTSFLEHRTAHPTTETTSQHHNNNIVPGEGWGEGSSTAQTDQGKKGSEVAGHGYSIQYILYITIVRGV